LFLFLLNWCKYIASISLVVLFACLATSDYPAVLYEAALLEIVEAHYLAVVFAV
jgi:hypothetical protein